MVILTLPVAVSLARANSKVATSANTIAKNATILEAITKIVELMIIGLFFNRI
jgi:hypothetical protein